MRRVVVTGLGVVSPLGVGKEEHWQALVSGRSAIARSRRLAAQGFPVDIAAEISLPALKQHFYRLPRKQVKLFSRVALFGMIASSLAADDAGLGGCAMDPTRFGVLLGTFFTTLEFPMFLRWMAEAESMEIRDTMDESKANAHCMTSINPIDYSLKTMPNLAAGHIAIAHNAQGFCRVIADGCTAGLQAIGQAYRAIKEDRLDIALCGGSEAPLEEFVFLNLCTLGFLAPGGDDPEKVCCPFGRARKGAVLGEGGGMLVLEEMERALQRGSRIYGEILGFGVSAGDTGIGCRWAAGSQESTVDSIEVRLKLAMQAALGKAGVDRVDLIAANGDSMASHDLAESLAIQEAFGPGAGRIPISAMKPAHGHLVSGSGAVELISCLLAFEYGMIPPNLNLDNPDPQCGLDFVSSQGRARQIRTALVNSVGLFGESASLIVQR